MARRDRRQTKRERKEEARRRRLEQIRRARRRARARKVVAMVVLLAAIGGVALAVVQAGQRGRQAKEELNELAAAAGCNPLQKPEVEGFTHIAPPATVQYGTSPPTSGNHYGGPTDTGVHGEPIQNEVQVHNLEHGHVLIQHNNLAADLLEELRAIVEADAEWLLMAPYPAMDAQVAFTSWGRLLTCQSPNDRVDEAARSFVSQFKDKGRESVPGQPVGAAE